MKINGTAIIIVIILVICLGGGISTYNSIVSAEEKVTNSYADIDTQLQRRADLIPNLVSSVKGYMEHEEKIIDSITQSRERLVNASSMMDRAQANDELTKAIEQLNVVVENYPDLKANDNFIQLQDELAGTENRIAIARKDYNQAVNTYNTKIKRFPGVFVANLFGFDKAEYFEAAPGSSEVPNVEF